MSTLRFVSIAAALCATLALAGCDRDAAAPAPAAQAPTIEPAPPPSPPAAEPPPAAPSDSGLSFADMDANKDGGLTLDELAASEMLHQHFSGADADGNGQLSPTEVDAHRAQMAGN